jgi:hypothetical protein
MKIRIRIYEKLSTARKNKCNLYGTHLFHVSVNPFSSPLPHSYATRRHSLVIPTAIPLAIPWSKVLRHDEDNAKENRR